ncbi:hypothetical protein Mic7113_4659 [Allocoleopsis franciscana PCC 7113]|uniref:Uncharacterized protein n=1 Tax=Allocoleopsis franciscana PCC 7113 TaxID=1173027 RepID=K9WLB3_9CYAN|nr:hypothetical protein Mic7113_4659 [Allocoleopsis franciscana PCC 7113]
MNTLHPSPTLPLSRGGSKIFLNFPPCQGGIEGGHILIRAGGLGICQKSRQFQ